MSDLGLRRDQGTGFQPVPYMLTAIGVLALLLAGAGSAGTRTERLRPVPILMYHVIAPAPAKAPYPDLYVQPADFAGQVAWLAKHGYTAVTLQRVLDAWRGAATLPAKPVVLSFDDGYLSQLRNALPVLQARGWPGVLNLEVKNLEPVWGIRPPGVRKLIKAGWEIDSHTINHLDLRTLGADALRHEVADSRGELRRRFHVPVSFFCYPAGRYDETVVDAVKAAGYLGATSTEYGLARPDDLYTLDRVRVNASDGVAGLARKLQALGAA